MKPFFKPHDFITAMTTDEYVPDHVADIANEKLKKIINESPVVYGVSDDNGDLQYSTEKFSLDTHKASLMFIEEIPKNKKCDHEPFTYGKRAWKACAHCGAELKCKWEELK